jgi:dipeptidyl aminopeptidase/acylaminoacyl peptidase
VPDLGAESTPARRRLEAWLDVPLLSSPFPTFDGSQVVYLSDAGGVPQPQIVDLNGGTPRPIVDRGERVGAVVPSPRSEALLLFVDRGGDEHWQMELMPERTHPEGLVTLTAEPSVIHSGGEWRDDGRRIIFSSNRRDRRFFDLYELDVSRPREHRALWTLDGHPEVLDSRGEGLVVANHRTNLDADLYLLTESGRRLLNPHEAEQSVSGAALVDGTVYAATNPGREFCALARYRPSGTSHEFLREYDGDVELLRASPDGRYLALVLNRQGWSDTRLYEVSTGEERALNSGPRGVVEALRWLPDSSGFVYSISSTEGVEIFRRTVATGKERRVAGPTPLVPVHRPSPRLGSFVASDGVTIPYWEHAPDGPKSKGTIVWVHGGPEAQARPLFSPIVEFLASEGWRIILPNVRGSTGYGRTFVHLDDVRKRPDSVRDLADLVGRLVRDGKAESGRVGVVGGSYGGFMVLSAASRYPLLWGAAIDVVGVANFVTFLEETGPWRRALREAEYGSLTNDREFLEEISPIHHAKEIRAPLLVVHGRNDPRVPVHEAEQIVNTLTQLGRPVELLVFDDEGHGIIRRPNRLVAWSRAVEFLEKHLTRVAPS